MKTQYAFGLTIICNLLIPSLVKADDTDPIDPRTLCERLQILEETLILNKDGTRIIDLYRNERGPGGSSLGDGDNESEEVCGRGSSSGFSASSMTGPIFFHHTWSVKKDGMMTVTYEQGSEFVGHGRDAKLKDSTGRKTEVVKDFQTVSWVSPFHKDQRVIVRLTPTLGNSRRSREVGKFPLHLSDSTIFDGKGNLWTANLTAFGDYIGVLTVEGGLMLSLQPFAEGEKIGKAHGREIRFSLKDGTSVLLKSADIILPGEMTTDVYVMHDPQLRAKNFGSQSVSSGDDAEETLRKLRRHASR